MAEANSLIKRKW